LGEGAHVLVLDGFVRRRNTMRWNGSRWGRGRGGPLSRGLGGDGRIVCGDKWGR
jgi:hypothetical protein